MTLTVQINRYVALYLVAGASTALVGLDQLARECARIASLDNACSKAVVEARWLDAQAKRSCDWTVVAPLVHSHAPSCPVESAHFDDDTDTESDVIYNVSSSEAAP